MTEPGLLPADEEGAPVRRSRREALLAGLTGLLAGGGLLARPAEAQASHAGALQVDHANTGSGETKLDTTVSGASDFVSGLTVTANEASAGVSSRGSMGVVGEGDWAGVVGIGNVGGVFYGADAALSLPPRLDEQGNEVAGPPVSPFNMKGDVSVDRDAVVWLCVADGDVANNVPGQWIQLSHGGTRLLPAPHRAYDSRQHSKFDHEHARTVPIVGVVPGVPPNALGIVGNIAALETESDGWATVYPAEPRPLAASINWFGPGQMLNNALTARLGPGGVIRVFAFRRAHLVIDVVGYIR